MTVPAALFAYLNHRFIRLPGTIGIMLVSLLSSLVLIVIGWVHPAVLGEIEKSAIPILTWGGLRGGLSVALALSIPPGMHGELIVTVTYIVVLFSILVQGLTIGRIARRLA